MFAENYKKKDNFPTFTPGLPVIAPSIFNATPSILSTSPGLRLCVRGVLTGPIWALLLVTPAAFFRGVAVVGAFFGVARGVVVVDPVTAFLILVVREGAAAGCLWERVCTGIFAGKLSGVS